MTRKEELVIIRDLIKFAEHKSGCPGVSGDKAKCLCGRETALDAGQRLASRIVEELTAQGIKT